MRVVAISPDGCVVASCGNDNLVKLWAIGDGAPLATLTGHDSHVYNLAFHPNRVNLAIADHLGIVKDWNWTAGRFVRDLDAKFLHKYDEGFRAHIGGLRGLAFDATGGTLSGCGITNVSNAFAGVGNPGVILFDWLTGKSRILATKDAYQGTAWGVHVHAAGFVLAAGGAADGRVWFWNLADGLNTHTLVLPSTTRDLAMHPDGTAFAVCCHNGSTAIYTMVK